jgi:ABC-type sugar transport system permease subunit
MANKQHNQLIAYVMLSPAVLGLVVFVIIPLFMALRYSFFDVSFYTDSVFVGLENFRIILSTTVFRQTLINAGKFLIIIVPGQMITAFLLANALRALPRAYSDFAKTALYIPHVISGIAIAMIFNFIFNYSGGVINQTIRGLGFERIAFFTNPVSAVFTISFVSIWCGLGGNTILMYAALINIPKEYYEAASVDGAGSVRKMFFITLPQMKNIFVLIVVNLTTGTLQMFDLPYMMTGGGPLQKTITPMLYIYQNYNNRDKGLGYAIAGALIIMVFISAVNSIIFRIIRSEKSLEG